MKTGKLTLIRSDPLRHKSGIFDLTAKTFGRNDYWKWLDYSANSPARSRSRLVTSLRSSTFELSRYPN